MQPVPEELCTLVPRRYMMFCFSNKPERQFQPQQRGHECFSGVRHISGLPTLACKSENHYGENAYESHLGTCRHLLCPSGCCLTLPRPWLPSFSICRKAALACHAAHRRQAASLISAFRSALCAEICGWRGLPHSQLRAAPTSVPCPNRTSICSRLWELGST